MTLLAGCVRRFEEVNWCVWMAAYLALYLVLDLATLAVTGAEGLGGVLVAVVWSLPLHLAALALASLQLLLLRALSDLSGVAFRVAAVGVFVVPVPLVAVALGGGIAALVLLPMHLVMGLLVVQPHRRWAAADPSMEQHRG